MTAPPATLLRTALYTLADGRTVLRDEATGTLEVHNAHRGEASRAPLAMQRSGPRARLRSAFHALQASVLVPQPSRWRRGLVGLVLPVPALNTQGRFLDVGCGVGGVLAALPAGWERVGVEPEESAATIAARHPNVTIHRSTFEGATIAGQFECIRACHVIEHTTRTDDFLSAIASHLADDGRALLYTPNADGIARRIFGHHWACFRDPTHVRLFGLDALARRCEAHGLTVVQRGTYEMGIAADSLLSAFGARPNAWWFALAQLAITVALSPLLWLANRCELGDASYLVLARRLRTAEASPNATSTDAPTTETISPA